MAINEEALSSSGTAAATATMNEDAAEKGFNLEEIRRKKQSPVVEQTSPVNEAKTAPQSEQKQQPQRVVNNRRRTLVARLQNWVDFNLKFKSPDLERIYERSYLSVTRFLFVRYLIYLSVFTLTWLVYLLVIGCFFDRSSCHATSQLNGYLQPVEGSTSSEWSYRVVYQSPTSANATNTASGSSGHNLPLFIYMAFMATIYVFIFVFVLFIELNERAYRSLKERLDQKELETKVDVNIAVSDLKKAMQQVLIKEAEYKSLKENVDLKFIDIDKMRTMYARVSYTLALVVVSLMFLLCFLMFCMGGSSDLSTSQGVITQVSHFIWFCEMLMLFYLIYPFDMLISVGLGIVASLAFEVLALQRQIDGTATLNTAAADDDDDHHQFNNVYLQSQLIIFVFVKILLHSSLHAIALYLKVSLQAIKRDTFLKIAHMHKAHLAAQTDKEITERMIKSIMPPLFTHVFGRPEDFKMSVARVHRMRPLFIYPVNQISILFADIVGFTRMSSKKTAEELVFLLNDLYGRFDRLCEKAGCEKISTLGDCYYCVSGCLNGRDDHAKCCVEMGLLMVKEIEMFNKCHNVDVNMRVGVHTGNALAGFIGGKRFRFDVWSSDVTIANKMESTGLPGRVHISEDTYKHLEGKFRTEPGEKYSGKGTYFVMQESKRETVADTLRFYESASVENSALKPLDQVNEQQQYTETSSFIKSGQQQTKDETATTSGEAAKAAESSGDAEADEDELLFLAIKDAHFIQPSLNPITMRFKTSEEESKFQAYLMGMNTQLLTTTTSQSTYSTTGHQAVAPPPPSQTYHQHHRHSSKFSNSLRIWAHPQNTLFVSFLLAVCVNLCLSTAYFLTFVVSSMSAYEYKLTDAYSSDFLLVLVFFGILCLVQFGFLLVNFWTCNRAMKKRQRFNNAPISGVHPSNSMATTEFSENLINNNANNHASKPSSIGDLESGNTRRFVPSAKPGGGPMSTHFLVSMSHQNQKRRRRRILIKFSLLHLISFVLLSLVPVYILTTALPSALPNMLSSSWSSIVSAANHSTSVDSVATKTTTTTAATIASTKRLNLFAMYSYFCYTIALIHFCSFVQLSALFKSLLALAFAATFSIISFLGVCTSYNDLYQPKSSDSLSNSTTTATKVTSVLSRALLGGQPVTIPFSFYTTQFVKGFISANAPILIDAALLVILIFLVNRHLEVTQRLSFRNDKTAQLKVAYAREQKELASWLIEVVLPAHVVSHVKEKKQYSRNYDCVGVLFVSLCNFSEFFEETFEGGRELLRVLNEITVDFDGLLDEPKYKNVEKIKSIGSTFMIASGLGADLDTDASTAAVVNNDAHLHELIEFALELYEKLETFNNEAMSVCHFKFQMRMGFNCGPVTAGVIGTERLLYDIWGDTVNVASRMDSTGQAGSIQCPERVAKSLANDYNFRERGAIQIKGKDQMVTYFMDPKENAPKRLN